MPRACLVYVSDLLHPYIKQGSTVMSSCAGVLENVMLVSTLYYLCDETANTGKSLGSFLGSSRYLLKLRLCGQTYFFKMEGN